MNKPLDRNQAKMTAKALLNDFLIRKRRVLMEGDEMVVEIMINVILNAFYNEGFEIVKRNSTD